MTKEPDDKQSVTVRLPTAMIERMDAWGVRHGVVKRSDVLRMLVTKALDADDPRDRDTLPADLLAALEERQQELGADTLAETVRKLLDRVEKMERLIDDAPEPKPGIIERGVKALKSMASDQSLSPAQRQAAKKG